MGSKGKRKKKVGEVEGKGTECGFTRGEIAGREKSI